MTYFTEINYNVDIQGANTGFWKSIAGALSVAGGYFVVNSGVEAISRSTFKNGVLTIKAAMQAPGGTAVGLMGLSDSAGNTAAFKWDGTDGLLYAVVSHNSDTLVEVPGLGADGEILWDASWDNAGTPIDLVYQIVWEPGLIKFYIDGINVATASDDSATPLIPTSPMGLWVSGGSASFAKVKTAHIEGQNVHTPLADVA